VDFYKKQEGAAGATPFVCECVGSLSLLFRRQEERVEEVVVNEGSFFDFFVFESCPVDVLVGYIDACTGVLLEAIIDLLAGDDEFAVLAREDGGVLVRHFYDADL